MPSRLVLSVAVEDDYVVDVGAIRHKLVLFQRSPYESFLAVDIEFLVGLGHFGGFYGVEAAEFRMAWETAAVLFLQVQEPVDGIVGEAGQMAFDFLDFPPVTGYELIGFF